MKDAAAAHHLPGRQLIALPGELYCGPPKSRASCRTIALDEDGTRRLADQAVNQAVELLRHQFTRQRYPDSRARTGPDWRRGRPMFAYVDARPIRPEYLSHRFRQICKELGLPPIRLHDLRHCAATTRSMRPRLRLACRAMLSRCRDAEFERARPVGVSCRSRA